MPIHVYSTQRVNVYIECPDLLTPLNVTIVLTLTARGPTEVDLRAVRVKNISIGRSNESERSN